MVWTIPILHVYACLLLCFMLVLASLVLGLTTFNALSGFMVVRLHPMPTRPCLGVTTWDVFRCQVAPCVLFLFSAPCDAMLTMLVCSTCWLSVHVYTFAYMSMHESCLLLCHPCFNTMTLWTFDPNLHLSLMDTTFYFLFLLVYLLACSLAFLFFACHVYHAYLLYVSFICTLHLFLPLFVCWFLVFAFACTHTKRGRMELRHGLLGSSKKG